MDTLLLSRIQFAANISFHILFPTINIALCWFLLYFRMRHSAAKGTPAAQGVGRGVLPVDQDFALTFALGVVTGITMSFQFGTNWPGYMEKAGNIAGPLLGYEVLTAFFLEATFLGIMLFGRGRVSDRVHLLATLMVAAGTTLSAFWILSLNSWMQTPTGYEIIEGKLHATSWLEVIFNPSFPYRLTHKLLASTLTASFLIAGLSAWQLLRNTANEGTHRALRAGGHRRGHRHSAADRRGRPARPEHAGAPAGEDRGDRGHLAHREERAADAVRLAQRKGAPHRLCDPGAQARQPDPGPRHRRRTQGLE